jgi:hypothetical protein
MPQQNARYKRKRRINVLRAGIIAIKKTKFMIRFLRVSGKDPTCESASRISAMTPCLLPIVK